ncbi:hypothetical protein ABPG74_011619 [Tetrahymena malaccensis]
MLEMQQVLEKRLMAILPTSQIILGKNDGGMQSNFKGISHRFPQHEQKQLEKTTFTKTKGSPASSQRTNKNGSDSSKVRHSLFINYFEILISNQLMYFTLKEMILRMHFFVHESVCMYVSPILFPLFIY